MIRVRALFVSDFHLGTASCQADSLLRFLQSYQTDTIYLVGDIIDGWRLLRGRSWPASHIAVAAELLSRARQGVRVVYIRGNHDEYLRWFIGLTVGGIEISESIIHESAAGQRYLVLHGDQVDRVVQRVPWAALIGNLAYRTSLAINRVTAMQRLLGRCCRAASGRTKSAIRAMVSVISRSEDLLTAEAKRLGVDGVVCGHTHEAADRELAGLHYLNTGDWVESCTGVVECLDGRLSMVRWAEPAAVQSIGSRLIRFDAGEPAGEDISEAA